MTPRGTRLIVGAAIVGLVVLTLFLAYEGLSQGGVAKIVGYQHFGDEHGIVVIVQVGALQAIAEREIKEDASTVKVTVHTRRPNGAVPAYLIVVPVPVSLHDGLRDRRVLDQDGVPVKDLGVYELPGRPTAPP